MKPHAVFLHYHGIGHINPCLALARILEDEHYEVHFAGAEFFKQYVSAQGFPFYALKSVPFGLGFETWMNTIKKKKTIYLSTLRDRITDRLYFQREAELSKMLNDLNPEIVLIDATQATDFIVLYQYLCTKNIKVGIVHAMFPTHVLPGRPPVNSDAFPENEKEVRLAIRKMNWQKRKKALRQKLKYLNFDDQYIINRRLKRNLIPAGYRSQTPSLFNFTISNVCEFILAPREFDFPDFKVEANQHYIGFMKGRQRHDQPDPQYIKTREVTQDQRTAKNLKLIYCSFGTIESDRQVLILSFLNKLVTVAQQENHVLVISLKAHSENISLPANADNIFVFKAVPQLEVLAMADLFITHGGLSSIKESIDAEVPMLMYPVHPDYDPKGNSARVEYHGMGLRGDINLDTEQDIRSKISKLLNLPGFKKNVVAMRQKNAVYTPEKFILLLKTLTPPLL